MKIIKYMHYKLKPSSSPPQTITSQSQQQQHDHYTSCMLPISSFKCLPTFIFIAAMIVMMIPQADCTTDVTLTNCPSQFNISKANITTAQDVTLINTFYSGFSSMRDNQRIENIVITGDTDDLWAYIKEKITPYAIFAGVVFGVFIMLLYYCLFDKSFPPCQSLRRNPMQKPYTVKQKRCMSYPLLLLAAIIFSAGIVSFTAIPNMKIYISYTKCALFNLLDVSIYGDQDNQWGGFTQLKNKIGNISSLLDSAGTQVGTYISGDEWLVTQMFDMKNKNIAIYNSNSDAQYISPNPVTTQTNLAAGLDYPVIDSVFIRTGLGPNGTFNTMVDDIDRELRVTEVKSKAAYQIEQSAQTMVQATSVIKTNAVAAQNTLAMYLRQLEVINTEMDQFAVQFFDNYFSLGVYVLQGVVGFVLVSSLLVLIGGLSTHCYQIMECRYMVHCGWFLYALMYFGMLVLAFVTISLGSVGFYACQYFNSSMTNQTSYYKIGQKYSQNAFNRLDVCILGDGNVLRKFNIDNEMRTVTDVFTNISAYFDYDNPSSTNYIDLNRCSGKINGWITTIQKYELGINIDSRPQETTNDNPNYALSQLNKYTNLGGGVPTCSRDRWVFDIAHCTDPNEQPYHADTLQHGQQLNYSSGVVNCISLNQRISTSTSLSWSQADLISRYLQIRQTCPDAYDKIIYYGSTLINYRQSRTALFRAIKAQLTELYTINTNFNQIMVSFRSKVNQYYQSVATLNNIISNQMTGLLVTSDCRVIGKSTQAVYNIFCVNFMLQVVKIGICTILMLITMMAAMCIGAIFGTRYANVQMLKRVNAEHEQVLEVSSEQKKGKDVFDKQIMFSQQSHSSQEDEKQKKPAKK